MTDERQQHAVKTAVSPVEAGEQAELSAAQADIVVQDTASRPTWLQWGWFGLLRWFRLPLAVRVFLLYFIFVGLTAYFTLSLVVNEVKPGVRQSTEETLVDVANLLAEWVQPYVLANDLANPNFAQAMQRYGLRQPQAEIWGLSKAQTDHRIYITDQRGMVLFDSSGQAVGQDYSRWNDVYKTLRGRYGARSTQADPNDPLSTVMHVAAPIYRYHDNGWREIIGVLTVAKPNRSVQPFIERSEHYIISRGVALLVLGLLVGALFAWRVQLGLNRLEGYAVALSRGERVGPPKFRLFIEFGRLAKALDKMRQTVAGQQYAEQYVQSLTHELKSPIAAIAAASELLQQPLPSAAQQQFVANIQHESARLQRLVEQMLLLSQLEAQHHLQKPQPVSLSQLVTQLLADYQVVLEQRQLVVERELAAVTVFGDPFLITQALGHLLQNAIDFADTGSVLRVRIACSTDALVGPVVSIENQGPTIPDYALQRLTERFYSLPRPHTGRKSTGLGLSFVAEVAALHHGQLQLRNLPNGVVATLTFAATAR